MKRKDEYQKQQSLYPQITQISFICVICGWFSCLYHLASLERLRNPEVQVAAVQPEDCRRAVNKTRRTTLRNQKLRWVQQKPVIHGECAAKRSLQPEAQSNRVGPVCAQISLIDGRENVSGRNRRRIFLSKQVANPTKHVAAIVKRHDLH